MAARESRAMLFVMVVEIPSTAVCLGCGYALRGLPEAVCPECGRAFDPADSTTYDEPTRPTGWRRWAQAPPLSRCVVAAMCAVAYAYWSSEPGGLLAGFGGVWMWPVGLGLTAWLVADYNLRVRAVIRDRRRASLDRVPAWRGGWLRWAIVPICLALIFSAMLTSWPMRLRFELSRGAFEDAVRKLNAGTDPKTLTGRIGLLPVRRITQYGVGGVYFQTGLAGWDRVGLDHCSADDGCHFGQLRLNAEWCADMH